MSQEERNLARLAIGLFAVAVFRHVQIRYDLKEKRRESQPTNSPSDQPQPEE